MRQANQDPKFFQEAMDDLIMKLTKARRWAPHVFYGEDRNADKLFDKALESLEDILDYYDLD